MRILLALLSALICTSVSAQQTTTNNAAVRFQAVDIFVDTKDKPLATYQVEFTVTGGNAKIVGIEGGEHPAFAEPPFYDSKAMQHERVIIAAFSTAVADKLPKAKIRVATIHLQISGEDELKFEAKLQTAASADGNKLPADVSSTEKGAK
jgi:hypothetical protein